ncbi:unnamed protein product [Lepeophtheirus salmonis]|uniref:(salmon louse) hypothetical protein n=1 Tax=Lepeophtheirus salmonis TaxID=72036 RepID=A0A7R8CFL6_LEPSM|nr:unnamed protein product [Lepeophtheirus salmonis]CAF2802014.1 unnamed protein product [Lepeophtheirus salmonis]
MTEAEIWYGLWCVLHPHHACIHAVIYHSSGKKFYPSIYLIGLTSLIPRVLDSDDVNFKIQVLSIFTYGSIRHIRVLDERPHSADGFVDDFDIELLQEDLTSRLVGRV